MQLRRPEVSEEITDRRQPVGADHEHVALPVATLNDQSRTMQDAQVVRRDLLRHAKPRRDLTHRPRFIADEREDAPAIAVGEGVPGDFLGGTSSRRRHQSLFKQPFVQMSIGVAQPFVNPRLRIRASHRIFASASGPGPDLIGCSGRP